MRLVRKLHDQENGGRLVSFFIHCRKVIQILPKSFKTALPSVVSPTKQNVSMTTVFSDRSGSLSDDSNSSIKSGYWVNISLGCCLARFPKNLIKPVTSNCVVAHKLGLLCLFF